MSRYIDADALIKRIQDEHKFGSLMLSNMIAEMPTADVVPMEFHDRCMELEIQKRANMVERKRGEWALNDDQVYECKDCGYVPSFDGYTYFNYCPNCGADMRGEDDELKVMGL